MAPTHDDSITPTSTRRSVYVGPSAPFKKYVFCTINASNSMCVGARKKTGTNIVGAPNASAGRGEVKRQFTAVCSRM